MAFAMDVGSDLYGTKHNVQLRFAQRPTVEELSAATESYFDTKARACRPAGYPDTPFRIETFQVFDDQAMRWVDLFDGQQLQPGQQVWCFQPESIWHSDAQGVIPEAERATFTWTTPLGSPRRARVAADAGVPPTLSEKLRSVFYQIDQGYKGFLLYSDLETAFQRCDMTFSVGSAGELFQMADENRSQHITYDEWVNFAIRCPSVVDALFFRFRDMGPAVGMLHPVPSSAAPQGSAVPQEATRASQPPQYQQVDGYGTAPPPAQPPPELPPVDTTQYDYDVQRAQQRESEAEAALQGANERLDAANQMVQQALAQREAAEQEVARAREEHQAAAAATQEAVQRQLEAQRAAAERAEAQRRAAEQAAAQAAAAAQQAAALAAAQQAAAQQAAAQQAAAQQAAAQQAAQQAAAQQAAAQQAAAQQAAAAAAAQRGAVPQQQFYYAPGQPHMQPAMQVSAPPTFGGVSSPERESALREYEAARRHADSLRIAKEEAEREERNAWDRLYYSPAAPGYRPGPSAGAPPHQ